MPFEGHQWRASVAGKPRKTAPRFQHGGRQPSSQGALIPWFRLCRRDCQRGLQRISARLGFPKKYLAFLPGDSRAVPSIISAHVGACLVSLLDWDHGSFSGDPTHEWGRTEAEFPRDGPWPPMPT